MRKPKTSAPVKGTDSLIKMNFLYTVATVLSNQRAESTAGLVRHLTTTLKGTGRKTVQRMYHSFLPFLFD